MNGDGRDVTMLLTSADRQMVSPAKLRGPQLRGLAETHAVTLDFGPLEMARPLVLALTGWLRFGGGMANVSASHDASLPFPFPALEVETAAGNWEKVDVVVGAPAGKTKTILADLSGKLPRQPPTAVEHGVRVWDGSRCSSATMPRRGSPRWQPPERLALARWRV
jgi:hypothetical protein